MKRRGFPGPETALVQKMRRRSDPTLVVRMAVYGDQIFAEDPSPSAGGLRHYHNPEVWEEAALIIRAEGLPAVEERFNRGYKAMIAYCRERTTEDRPKRTRDWATEKLAGFAAVSARLGISE